MKPRETASFLSSPYAKSGKSPAGKLPALSLEPTSKQRGYMCCTASGSTIPMPRLSEYPRHTKHSQTLCPYDAMFGYTCVGSCNQTHITERNSPGGYPKGYLPMLHKFIRNNKGKVCWHPLEAQNVCIDPNFERDAGRGGDDVAADDPEQTERKKHKKDRKKSKRKERG